eukprot:287926-Chlamydomonas_euryale.AAC.1
MDWSDPGRAWPWIVPSSPSIQSAHSTLHRQLLVCCDRLLACPGHHAVPGRTARARRKGRPGCTVRRRNREAAQAQGSMSVCLYEPW